MFASIFCFRGTHFLWYNYPFVPDVGGWAGLFVFGGRFRFLLSTTQYPLPGGTHTPICITVFVGCVGDRSHIHTNGIDKLRLCHPPDQSLPLCTAVSCNRLEWTTHLL